MSESNGERLHAAFVTVGCYSMAWAGLLDVERDDFARAAAEYDRVAAERIAELEGEAIERQALFDKTFATLDETCTLFEQCAAENGALRERLAKLEAVAKESLGCPTAPFPGCECCGNLSAIVVATGST
jgi:hypothetical protein